MGGYTRDSDFEFLSEELKNYINEVNEQIISCFQCQPYDSEEKEIVWIEGDRFELADIFSDNDIPEQHWDEIIPYIKCPQCGNVFDYIGDEVGIMGEYEHFFQQKYDEIVKISKEKIQSFYEFLSKYPYLGIEHEAGQEIKEEIKTMRLQEINDTVYYRARKPHNGKIFKHEDMLNPPQTVEIPEGRFNHYGQSHLYLGETEEICTKEVTSEEQELLWLQKYKIVKLERILDVTEYIAPYNIEEIPLFFAGLFHSGLINVQKSNKISWTPEYFIPRFVADIARLNGINGILYQSMKTIGNNLVIFNMQNCIYEFEGDPYTFLYNRKIYKEPVYPF